MCFSNAGMVEVCEKNFPLILFLKVWIYELLLQILTIFISLMILFLLLFLYDSILFLYDSILSLEKKVYFRVSHNQFGFVLGYHSFSFKCALLS